MILSSAKKITLPVLKRFITGLERKLGRIPHTTPGPKKLQVLYAVPRTLKSPADFPEQLGGWGELANPNIYLIVRQNRYLRSRRLHPNQDQSALPRYIASATTPRKMWTSSTNSILFRSAGGNGAVKKGETLVREGKYSLPITRDL